MNPMDWLLGYDKGTSSITIFCAMTGTQPLIVDVPYDSDDFGRCYRLLRSFPEWRSRLGEVAVKYPIWGPMVEAWDELTQLFEAQLYGAMDARMRVLNDACRRAAGWTQTSPGCCRGPVVQVAELTREARIGGKA